MMYKKLKVLVVSAVLAVPLVVQGSVEVYGQARMSVDFNSNNDASPGSCDTSAPRDACKDSAMALTSHASRLGFRGNEDLGRGLKLLWQLEQQVDFDTGISATGGRNSFVGFAGDFGVMQAGKNESPLRAVTQRLDVFADTWADYNAIIGNLGGQRLFDLRSDNTVMYTSPNLQGFGFAVAYATSIRDDNLPITTLDSDRNLASVNGSYASGPLYLAVAFESLGNITGTDDATATRLGASWTLAQATTLAGVWESADRGGVNGDRDAWYLNVAHKMGAHTLKAAVAAAGEMGGAADTGALQYTLGWAHDFSRSTDIYALYTVVDNDAGATYGLWSGSQAIAGFANESVSSLSVGLNHRFSSR